MLKTRKKPLPIVKINTNHKFSKSQSDLQCIKNIMYMVYVFLRNKPEPLASSVLWTL